MIITHNNQNINLTINDFLSEGGEGKVYIKNNVLFKIYHKTPIPLEKITELKTLSKSNIMIPQNPIHKDNKYVGFSMKYVDNTVPLCKLFTNTFRDSNRINPDTIIQLIQNIQKTIKFIHSKNCIMVDGNEFNYLVDKINYSNPYFIDVDSYKTPNHPATAIMPTIRDWRSSEFSQLTDWFSFAIIACQLFVGIHPFKGNHPLYSKKDLKKRMLDCVSIFNPKTKVPMSVRDFSHIPSEYKAWFLDLFEEGNRSTPPASSTPQIVLIRTTIKKTKGYLAINIIREYPQKIINYYSWKGYETSSQHKIIFLQDGIPLIIEIKPGRLSVHNNNIYKEIKWEATQLLIINNSLFTIHKDTVTEITILKNQVGIGNSWNILPHAHKVLDGFIYQNILGRPHLDFFYKVNNKTNHSIIPISELKGYRIIDGKYENKVCMIKGFKNGIYDEFILIFNEKFTEYSCIKTENIDDLNINMIVLDNGLALVLEDGKLRLFSNNPNTNNINIVRDKNLNSEMRLCHNGNKVQFCTDNKLYLLRMKK